jgi:hypothetical protein
MGVDLGALWGSGDGGEECIAGGIVFDEEGGCEVKVPELGHHKLLNWWLDNNRDSRSSRQQRNGRGDCPSSVVPERLLPTGCLCNCRLGTTLWSSDPKIEDHLSSAL